MKIEEMEPFVISKGMEPKHLICGKGGKVKWLVCLNHDAPMHSITVYDEYGEAYESDFIPEMDDDFFENMNIHRGVLPLIVIANGMECKYFPANNYFPDWKKKAQKKNEGINRP